MYLVPRVQVSTDLESQALLQDAQLPDQQQPNVEQKSDEPVPAAKAAIKVCIRCLHLIGTMFLRKRTTRLTYFKYLTPLDTTLSKR